MLFELMIPRHLMYAEEEEVLRMMAVEEYRFQRKEFAA
jgi:hypothetical protein